MKKTVLMICAALIFGSTVNAGTITFSAPLNGASEVPPTASPGTGFATVIFNTTANTMEVEVSFAGLLGTTTASHIHCCTPTPDAGSAGVATTTPTFPSFPLGVTSGTYDQVFDMTLASSYNPAFVSANGGTPATAETALLAGMLAGETYLNIHTTVDPGGEISGFLAVVTPEPSTLMLAGVALIALVALRRFSQSRA